MFTAGEVSEAENESNYELRGKVVIVPAGAKHRRGVRCASSSGWGRRSSSARGEKRKGARSRRIERTRTVGRGSLRALRRLEAEDISRLINHTSERYGRLDCLINNAGWHPPHKPIDEFSVEEFRQLLDLNLVSIFAACKSALPHLRATRGNIINLSSLVAQIGQLHATTYVATKGAITSFTKALAIDEAANGVRVNSVSPGNIYTPLWQEAIDAAPDPDRCRADGDAAQLVGRMGTIEEAGRLCLFIAAEATFTTGVDHILSGGAELAYGRKSRVPERALLDEKERP